MKRKLLLGLAVLTIIAAACNNPFFPDKIEKGLSPVSQADDDLVISVDGSGKSEVECVEGEKITLTVNVDDDEENYTFQWFENDKNSNEGGTLIEGETGSAFQPPTDEEGTKYYYVEVVDKRTGKKSTSKPIKVTVNPKVYNIVVDLIDNEQGDTVTASPNSGIAGDTITLAYTVANKAQNNLLNFGGVTSPIDSVNSAGSGIKTYVINAADASSGIITITAVFEHTNLEIDPIAFTDTAGHIAKTYGDAAFTNAVKSGYKGTGAITYSSSDTSVATVNNSGQVTIYKVGHTVITAEKAADTVYAHAQAEYTLAVNPKPVTITGLSVSNKVYDGMTTATVTGTAVISGKIIGDDVSIVAGTAVFANATVGSGKTVTFSGWSLSGANAGNYILSAQPASVTANINALVTFNSNGGSSVSDQTITAGGTVNRPANPTRSSYTFDYWYQDSGLTNPYNFSTPVTASIILYAKWISNTDITGMAAKDMVWIAGGSFTMGSPVDEPNRSGNEKQHSVTLNGFYMGKYQVTQEKYQAVMGSNPSYFSSSPQAGETQGKRPVENVSWYDTLVFCNKLSVTEGLSPAYSIKGSTDPASWGIVPSSSDSDWDAVVIVSGSTGYRLPTEAQWEYACRAGTTTAYNTGNTISDNTGWYYDNSGSKPHEVGKKPANAWGLYDMHGNVFEWCWDWYKSDITTDNTNPTGAVTGSGRVDRGGDWNIDGRVLRSAYRRNNNPNFWSSYIGFRLVRS